MSQVVENQTELQTQASIEGLDTSGSKRGNRKGCRGCLARFLLALFLLVMLVVIGIGVAYYLNRKDSDRKLNDHIDLLTQQGQPLSVDQVVEQSWSLPDGTLNTTHEWKSAVESFNSDAYTQRIQGTALVGDDSEARWPPTTWRDFDSASQLIDDFRRPLIGLQLATAGNAILEKDFLANPKLPDETILGLSRAFDFLELSCYVAAHNREQDRLVLRLLACLTYSNCLSQHPGHISDKLYIDKRAIRLLMRAVSEVRFSKEELTKFRDQIEGIDPWKPIHDYWNYQRALRLMMYTDLDRFRQTEFFQQLTDDPKYESFIKNLDTNIKYSPFSGDDAIEFLDQMKSVSDMFDGNPVSQAKEIAKFQSSNSPNHTPEGLDRYRFPTARFMVPNISDLIAESGDVAVYRNVALALLAADQFRMREERLPGSLTEAIDGFLQEPPVDWYTDKPVTLIRKNNALQVLSFGHNGNDNQLGQDDIGFALPMEKWDALSGPVEKID